MARKKQKLINYHGSDYKSAVAADLNLGEIAVATKTGDEHLGIKNEKGDLVWFMTSAQTVAAITASANHSVVSAASDADFIKVTTEKTASGADLYVITDAGVSGNIVSAISKLSGDVKSYVDTVSGRVENTITKLSGDVKDYVETVSGRVENTITKLSGDVKDYVETVSGRIESTIIKLSGDVKDYVKEVSGDIVTYVDEKVVSAASQISITEGSKPMIQLKNADGTLLSEADASRFVVDGMLSGVTYSESAHTMIFVWNTAASGKTITVDLDDIMQPVSADGKTLTATTKSDARGTLVFSAIMDETDGVASYAGLSAVSAKTATAIQSVTFSAATDDANKFVTVATGETGDDFAKQANLSLDLNVQTGASSDANDKLAAVSYVNEVSGNIATTVIKLSGDAQSYVNTVSGYIATTIAELSAATINKIEFADLGEATSAQISSEIEAGMLAEIDGQTIKIDNTYLTIDCGTWD